PDEELIGFDRPLPTARGTTTHLSAWERFNQRLPVTGSQTIAEYLLDSARDTDGAGAHAYRQSLAAIEGLPTAELERLFTATLDTCSHRLDAWITSLATKRLASMRTRNASGAHWGAYGWIENLRPLEKPQTESLADGRIAIVQTNSDGYIQAPTMMHASAGAVLRNAYRTRSGGDSERYGIDLSSDRVRRALRILEKVRSGESLGSALGHQFERGLRDRSTPHAAVDSMRNLFPLVANKLADSHQPADAVAARNVVDGLRLIDAYRDGSITFDESVLPVGSGARSAVERELKEIEDTIDSISDLFTAESVFQSMRGNTAAAAASLDAIAGGMRPPELECVQQPRGGTALTHRFAVVLGGAPVATPLWTAPPSPKSIAEPLLDGWIGSLLGDPATIRCRTKVINPSLPIEGSGPDVSLADLQLRPIDFLSLAIDAAENVEGISELDILITRFVGMPSVGIDNTPWPDRTIRTFVDAIETARAIRALIAASRPLRAEDLVAPENAKKPAPTVTPPSTRAADAGQKLLDLHIELVANSAPGFDAVQLDATLVKASQFGIKGALTTAPILFPDVRDELAERTANVLREIYSRIGDAGRPIDNKTEDEIARAVFGADFILLPSFTPTRPAELAQALAYAPTLTGNDPRDVASWIRKAAPVRDPVALFRALSVRANALGGFAAPFAVVQLPFAANASWVALPFADEAHRPPSGRASIVLQRASAPAATDAWAGLLIDEWSEIIPSASEQTAVSLQYDHPRAEAPQAVLIAVPPGGGTVWDFESLLDCVRETLQLAKVRGSDLETLGTIGQIVPALCLASNANGDAVSAPLSSMLEQPASLEVPQT
ncbi:MAG: hypothetical protein QOE68_2922, partial [Thermoanaerobaculia bacterium]|nr:hypothetical protein [Thermoanaerobaculia bacterium]